MHPSLNLKKYNCTITFKHDCTYDRLKSYMIPSPFHMLTNDQCLYGMCFPNEVLSLVNN